MSQDAAGVGGNDLGPTGWLRVVANGVLGLRAPPALDRGSPRHEEEMAALQARPLPQEIARVDARGAWWLVRRFVLVEQDQRRRRRDGSEQRRTGAHRDARAAARGGEPRSPPHAVGR